MYFVDAKGILTGSGGHYGMNNPSARSRMSDIKSGDLPICLQITFRSISGLHSMISSS